MADAVSMWGMVQAATHTRLEGSTYGWRLLLELCPVPPLDLCPVLEADAPADADAARMAGRAGTVINAIKPTVRNAVKTAKPYTSTPHFTLYWGVLVANCVLPYGRSIHVSPQ